MAAILLAIAVPSYYFIVPESQSFLTSVETETAMQNIQTARGERASMEFSDGSRVILNSMSTLRFPKVFEGTKRELHLEGEAFFQVAHNKERPFVVHANGVEVNVLGTEFNVNSYRENEAVEVVVREGKVAVNVQPLDNQVTGQQESVGEAGNGVILTRGQRTTVAPGGLPARAGKRFACSTSGLGERGDDI
ncbi:MAG: FecR domain-containing protein [Balneolaceae bacterium]|nr:FecR domain-containing protein [Balneolaceae bacterium]